MHVGAYDIDERIHHEICSRFEGACSRWSSYLRSRGVFFTFNHPFFFFKGQLPLDTYLAMVHEQFSGIEVRNGTMLPEHNRLVEAIARRSVVSARC